MDEIAPRESSKQDANARKLDPLLPLKPRLERFAQGRASGLSQIEAYLLAGYGASSAKAYALDKKAHVRARINDLAERGRAAAASGLLSKTGEILPADDPAPAEVTIEWVMSKLIEIQRLGRLKVLTAAEVNALTRVYETMGRQLGMWQTPYTPPPPPDQEDSIFNGGFRLDEAFHYMVREIGYEKATGIMLKLAPPAAKAPAGGNGNGQGNGTTMPPKPNGKANGNGSGH